MTSLKMLTEACVDLALPHSDLRSVLLPDNGNLGDRRMGDHESPALQDYISLFPLDDMQPSKLMRLLSSNEEDANSPSECVHRSGAGHFLSWKLLPQLLAPVSSCRHPCWLVREGVAVCPFSSPVGWCSTPGKTKGYYGFAPQG